MPSLPSWRQMNADVSPDVEALQLACFRRAPDWEKLEMLVGLNLMAYDMVYLSLQRRYPEASEEELNERLVHAINGMVYASRVPGPAKAASGGD